MRQRVIVCPIIENNGEVLLCKMADDRGVFPGNGRYPVGEWSRENKWKKPCCMKLLKSWAQNSR